MSHKCNRRDFLKSAALAGTGFWIAGRASAAEGKSANDKINFASIGVGGKGDSDTSDAARSGNLVAICDVDDDTLNKAAGKYRQAKKFNDFRKMFDEMGKDIDAVTVSTPDHTHAVAAVAAMRLGKHCFVQKPLTHTIYEARRMGEIAREMKVATQMGNQGTDNDNLRHSAALLKAGAVGTVSEVHVWTGRPVWPQGIQRPAPKQPPEKLHWDLWLGPAAERPYGDGYHPFKWRGFWAFGTGALGDMACHTMNMPYMGLDLREPTSVEAQFSENNKESYPKWSIIRYSFPARGSRAALTMTWYDGGKKPSADLFHGERVEGSGSLVIGDKGALYCPGDYGEGRYRLLGKAEDLKVEYPHSPGHFAEFVRAIRGGPPAMSNFPDYGGPLTETLLLGNLAVWAGKKVEWDAKNMKATNAPEVEPIIRAEYRKGYTL